MTYSSYFHIATVSKTLLIFFEFQLILRKHNCNDPTEREGEHNEPLLNARMCSVCVNAKRVCVKSNLRSNI